MFRTSFRPSVATENCSLHYAQSPFWSYQKWVNGKGLGVCGSAAVAGESDTIELHLREDRK